MFCQRLTSTFWSLNGATTMVMSAHRATLSSTIYRTVTSEAASQYVENGNRGSDIDGATMNAWLTHAYGTFLQLESVPRAQIWRDDQCLIKVEASSVNPIDVRMATGYGNEILSSWWAAERASWRPWEVAASVLRPLKRGSDLRLPLITGRDFCGQIVQAGLSVKNYRIGDKIIGVVPVHWPQGAHAQYVVAPCGALAPQPTGISAVDSCALCYTACTVWNAFTIARIGAHNAAQTRVLIHGGSGGVGTTAIQLLRAWGVRKIVATSSAKNMDMLHELGAEPVDYASPTAQQEIIAAGPFEFVLSCLQSPLSDWSDSIMGTWRNCVHVSLVSPILHDTDRYGIPLGLASSFVKYITRSLEPATQGRWFSYAFFMPSVECLTQLSALLEQKKIIPIIERVYDFKDLPLAYEKVGQLHGRGKSVVEFNK